MSTGYYQAMKRLVEQGEMVCVEDADGGHHYERTEKGEQEMAKRIAESQERRKAKLKELKEQGIELIKMEPIDLDDDDPEIII